MTSRYDLTTQELMVLQSEMRAQEKSLGIAYLMLIGGHLGLHRFYVDKKTTGGVQLALFVAAVAFYIAGIPLSLANTVLGFVMISFCLAAVATLTVWVIVDLFLLPGYVREWNVALERKLIDELMSIRREKERTRSVREQGF